LTNSKVVDTNNSIMKTKGIKYKILVQFGAPRIREFGNVKPSRFGIGGFIKPEISGETEPLIQIKQKIIFLRIAS